MTQRWIPFRDLRITDHVERKQLLAAVDAVFQHGRFILGPEVSQLEERLAAYCGRRYGVAVNSGTDALFLGLKSLGIGPGDEVITTSLSWIATANAIALTGATPVFADIRDDLNVDPDSVARRITSRTKALLPVHFMGKVSLIHELDALAKQYGLHLIEDAAQAFGARRDGRVAGSFGTLACFSLNPMKPYASCGEAGMVLTDREDIMERLCILRYNGTIQKQTCIEPSLNGRIDTLQAALLLVRLDGLESITRRRQELVQFYHAALEGVVGRPLEAEGEQDCYYTYTIQVDRRDELMAFLMEKGIESQIHHPILMPRQPAYSHLPQYPLPNAERLVKRILCIPMHEKMTDDDAQYVADQVRAFYR